MEEIKKALLELILQCDEETGTTPTMLKKELVSAGVRYFNGDRKYVQLLTDIQKKRIAVQREIADKQLAAVGGDEKLLSTTHVASAWGGEWNPNSGKKRNNGQPKTKEVVVDKTPADEPDEQTDDTPLTIQDFIGATEQDVLSYFGSTAKLKEFSREIALPIKQSLRAAEFLTAFVDYVAENYGSGEEEPDAEITQEEE